MIALPDIHALTARSTCRRITPALSDTITQGENGAAGVEFADTLKILWCKIHIQIEAATCQQQKGQADRDGVTEAQVSHETGTAVVRLDADVSDETLKQAVEEQDYTVVSVQRK